MFEKGRVTLDLTGYIKSASAPGASDRDKLWIKIDGSTRPVGHFIYYGGLWIWPHEVPAGGSERRIWVGDTATLQTYDGGAVGTVSDAGGPMWAEDTDLVGRIPIGVGAIASATIAPTSLTVGQETGTPEHTNTVAEMAAHAHGPPSGQPATQIDRDAGNYGIGLDSLNQYPNATSTWTASVGGGAAYSILPPVRAVYFIKRTARIFRQG